jgi:hypothetical protein
MTEVRLPAAVKAVRVDDLFQMTVDDLREAQQPGHFKFYRFGDEPDDIPPAGLNYWCPCGCGNLYGIAFRHRKQDVKRATWTWDGDYNNPTCTPSIQSYAADPESKELVKHWHGFLTAGYWVQA